jgi:activator of HSP90 ATPase
MPSSSFSRRAVTVGIAATSFGVGFTGRALAEPGSTHKAEANGDGLSGSSQSIHQEVTFGASCQRVDRALTNAPQFDALTRLGDAASRVAAPGAQATAISSEVGGAFTLFGGYITGRHLQMVQDERLVQAWRTGSWNAGDYSIVRFSLAAATGGCKLVFDHRGFPDGEGASLVHGWRVNYWVPLAKLLAQGR